MVDETVICILRATKMAITLHGIINNNALLSKCKSIKKNNEKIINSLYFSCCIYAGESRANKY